MRPITLHQINVNSHYEHADTQTVSYCADKGPKQDGDSTVLKMKIQKMFKAGQMMLFCSSLSN